MRGGCRGIGCQTHFNQPKKPAAIGHKLKQKLEYPQQKKTHERWRTTTCRPEGLWFLFLSGFWFSGFLPQALSPALAAGPFLFIGRRLFLCICGRLFVCAFVAGSFVFTGRRLFFSALAAGPFLFINRRLFLCIGRGLSFLHWSQALFCLLAAGSFCAFVAGFLFAHLSQGLLC